MTTADAEKTVSGDYDITPEGLVVTSLNDDLHEPIDPRIPSDSRPSEHELDEGLARQFTNLIHHPHPSHEKENAPPDSESEPLYVEFHENDARNPMNFSKTRKWAITYHACYATMIAASTTSAYNLGFASMARDLDCTNFEATIGLSVYALGFGLVPLVSASFSEEFGRQPMYITSAVIFVLMYVMIAEAQNIQTVILARFFQGAAGSTWSTLVGGTLSDIWKPHERGLPMSIFSVAALGGTGVGPLIAGWIEMNPRMEWKWIQWIQAINCGLYMMVFPLIMKETRSSIILTRLAKRIRKETGNHRYRARIEDERASLRTLIFISCTRPIHLLCTELIVSSFSLWVGFAWGVLYCMVESIGGVFGTLHGFNVGQIGTVFITMTIGAVLGFFGNFYQEHLYRKYYPRKGPEARLYMACFAAFLLPISLFIYSWCAYVHVTWVAQAIAIVLFIWAASIIYLCVFTYLADCYGPFASSALAGQSLCRNLAGTAFPLFTTQMFDKLGYRWANTLFGCIAAAMIPIPFILFFYGPTIRMRSKFSRMVLEGKR